MSQNNLTFTIQNSKLTKRIFLSPPHMSGEEMRFVQEAFDSNYIAPVGPQVDAFEREFAEYVGIRHCLALSSGTAAMHLALRLMDVGPAPVECASLSPPVNSTGQADDVIASTLTFIGSVTPVVFQGASLVFVDCDRQTWNMDPDLLAEGLEACQRQGRLPRAVIPTDLYGQCCNYDRILEICEEYEVPVVVDAAEALGAHFQKSDETKAGDQSSQADLRSPTSDLWRHAGVGAKAAVFSFNGNKIITTSGGGMLASDDKEFIDYARKLSQQAREDLPHYEHQEIGYNYRMSNILAAIGRGQLKVLDERVKQKREIFDYYQEALGDLPGIEFMPEPEWSRSNRWLTVILVTPEEFGAGREAVRLALEAENIEARPVWKPMHMQPVFQVERLKAEGSPEEWPSPRLNSKDKNIQQGKDSTPVPSSGATGQAGQARLKAGENDPQISQVTRINGRKKAQNTQNKNTYKARVVGGEVAQDLFKRGLCLPSGTAMTEEDLNRVIETILNCRKEAQNTQR